MSACEGSFISVTQMAIARAPNTTIPPRMRFFMRVSFPWLVAGSCRAEAVHKLEWYALRWKIETFFRTLKTGCRIEELRLATADRLANCIALCSVVAWRVSWLTMLSREAPGADPAAVFTDAERYLLEKTAPDTKRKAPRDLDFYLRAVARLGGYLDRISDPPPGTTVIWRGFSRLADLVEGTRLAKPPPDTCG